MTSDSEKPVAAGSAAGAPGSGPAGASAPSGLAYVPVAWLIFMMAWSVYAVIQLLRVFGNYGLPKPLLYFLLAGFAFDIVTILWGLYLLGLAFRRSLRFPDRFTIWQIVAIVWVLGRMAYVIAVPESSLSAWNLALGGGEIAMGVLCIWLLRRGSAARLAYSGPQVLAPSLGLSIIAASLGIMIGAFLGAFGGFLLGAGLSELTDMSCFEGSCGYFALFIGIAGLAVGAIAGGILGVWLVHRRKNKAGLRR